MHSREKRPPLLLAAAVVLVTANLIGLLWLVSKVSRMDQQLATMMRTAKTGQQANDLIAAADPSAASHAKTTGSPSQSGYPADDLVSRTDAFKQRDVQVPPQDMARDLDRLLYGQPADPAREAQQRQWLQDAAIKMAGKNVPKAQGIGSTCQGSRCVVTASFSDSNAAQDWAMHYLLTAGGTLLANSQTVILPAANGGSGVTLQLYLY